MSSFCHTCGEPFLEGEATIVGTYPDGYHRLHKRCDRSQSSVICPKCHKLGDHWVEKGPAFDGKSIGYYSCDGETPSVERGECGKIIEYDPLREYVCPSCGVPHPNGWLCSPPETILQEAQRLVYGARRADYGHPLDNFTHTAALINAHFGDQFSRPLTAEQVGELMILLKLSRQHNKPTRDNLTDIAGYAGCIEAVESERKRRENDGRTQGQ